MASTPGRHVKMRAVHIVAGALLVSQASAWAPMGLSSRPMGSPLPLRAAASPSARAGRFAAPVMMAKAKSAAEALRQLEEKQKQQVDPIKGQGQGKSPVSEQPVLCARVIRP